MTAGPERERYRVLDVLGRGGMGRVELVHDELRGGRVARKRLLTLSASGTRRLKREFRTLVTLEHAHLVRLYELDEDEEGTFYTMEWIEGSDLSERLDSIDAAIFMRDLLPQLLSALTFLHSAGLVHGDLKPANVRVAKGGTLKLLDFGLTAAAGHVADEIGGTPRYLAPETRPDRPVSAAADAYALGILLFEVVSGRPPTHRRGERLGPSDEELLQSEASPSRASARSSSRSIPRDDSPW